MWIAVQCAVQGKGHKRDNTPCQDKTCFKNNDETYVVSLADGAGSCCLSHIGAEAVTRKICDIFLSSFNTFFENDNGAEVKRDILGEVGKELKIIADEQKCSLKDLSSTLLMVAVKDDKFIICHIGDGVIGYMKNGVLKPASVPSNGEFVNTTIFTTSADAIQSMKLIKGRLNGIESFVLMSDGPESVFYSKMKKTLASGLKKIILSSKLLPTSFVENRIREFFETIAEKHTLDDCSLICFSNVDNFSFESLSFTEKCDFLNLRATKRRTMRRYFAILERLFYQPLSCKELSKKVHLKPRYLEKRLQHLIKLGVVENSENLYHLKMINYR